MIVKIVPTTEQIAWHVNGALGCFETLGHDPELAISECCRELRQILEYLEAVDGANNVHADFSGEGGKTPLVLKGFIDKDNHTID